MTNSINIPPPPLDINNISQSINKEDGQHLLWEVLMVEITAKSNRVLPLINAINSFRQDEKAGISKLINNYDYNLLMLALLYESDGVLPLINVTSSLEQDDIAIILKQFSFNGWNALMFAASYQPYAVEPLLNLISSLEQDDIAYILKQSSSKGWNALMIAVNCQPSAVKQLLNLISSLKEQDKILILEQVSKDEKWTPLALEKHNRSGKLVLNAVNQLNKNIEEENTQRNISSSPFFLRIRSTPDETEDRANENTPNKRVNK